MKKTILFSLILLIATAVTAQNRAMLFQESFDNAGMPSGWSVTGQGTSNWSVDASNKAGGQPNELHLAWSPQFNGLSRMLMGTVDLTGVTGAVFSFKQSLDNYSGSTTIGFSTSSDGGNTWNDAWSQAYSSSSTSEVMVNVTTADFGHANVMLSFYFNGSSYNINDWYFDDFQLFTLENLDLSLASINLAAAAGAGEIPLSVTVTNMGSSEINNFEMCYTIDDNEAVVENFETTIPSLGSETVTFGTMMSLIPGAYHISVAITLVNGMSDDDASNNTKETDLSCAFGAAERIPMIEHFSSSTCGPCVNVNTQMLTFTNNNPGRFTYTKYQMNWPGNGDPYYTAEGGVRRTYYGVSAVPQCFLDGEDQGYAAVQQSVFDAHASQPAFVDIKGYYSVEGTTVSVMVDVMSFIDLDAKLFVSVNEKETHNNVGGNGETSFHHIFMKYLTSSSGDALTLNATEHQRFTYSYDMSSTFVEEMDDLEVAVWVQNYGSKEMYNSHYMYSELMPYPVENLTLTEDEESGVIVVAWEAPAEGSPLGYDLIVNNVMVAEHTTDLRHEIPADPEQLYIVQVKAYYGENNLYSVPVMAYHTIYTGAEEVAEEVCRMYPNPANTMVHIEAGTHIQTVSIYNMLGSLVGTMNANAKSVNVNTSELSNGIYFIDLKLADGQTMTQRLIINH